jgi:lipopolysaccharide/colanic/teichoic acid biosynthesis glycosyltransferase
MGASRSRDIKRAIDLVGSVVCFVTLSIPVAVIWVLVRLTAGPPAIFKQTRPGLGGLIFQLYKFRTMTDARNPEGVLLPDERRVTDLGRFLRRTSLDELPELFNVLRGDMSLVGPRPLLVDYLDRYTPEQARRHEMRPGITGWAQVKGRNALSWEEKFALDVWYVDNWTIGLDLRILWMTVQQVIRGRGVHAEGHPTMPEFTGTTVDEVEA